MSKYTQSEQDGAGSKDLIDPVDVCELQKLVRSKTLRLQPEK
jgi:hypothetical protein